MQNNQTERNYFFPVRTISILGTFFSAICLMAFGIGNTTNSGYAAKDSVKSVKAFMEVYKVLMSPRCMNCHPAGDIPLQGDDNHVHLMNPIRGEDGHGVYAMKCVNCHQPTAVAGPNMPPGNPKWALPPADMKMVFEGKTPRQLALQIMDFNQNGHKDKAKLIEHARDTLVKAGWNMGGGRKPPPLTYKAFVAAWDTWINNGGYAPAK